MVNRGRHCDATLNIVLVVILCALVILVGATGKLQTDVKARDVFSVMGHQHEWLLEVATLAEFS
jgi:hypothetical protein